MVFRKGKKLVILELAVGSKTNMSKNLSRKKERYENLLVELSKTYSVNYINLSLGAIGIICQDSNLKSGFCKLDVSSELLNFVVKRITNVCIRTSYYIFCSRNKTWDNPALMCW